MFNGAITTNAGIGFVVQARKLRRCFAILQSGKRALRWLRRSKESDQTLGSDAGKTFPSRKSRWSWILRANSTLGS
jgi:hypothetical protein